ncbi:hypothetical protein BHM03_00018672 [Ensete ventricosum]|uniref:Uncharacterized protein n=1 Tax=Ensete ventricosum TaxID=4639 RepID=A0A445MF91_ENSVE|nr:hypothetical protein BHM03_00018672 [Ensete ventricosum]
MVPRYRTVHTGILLDAIASFRLPKRGNVSSPRVGRRNLLRGAGDSSPAGDKSCRRRAAPYSRFFFSLFFFLPRLIPREISRRRSKSIVTAQQRPTTVVINRYRAISGGNRAETTPIAIPLKSTVGGRLRKKREEEEEEEEKKKEEEEKKKEEEERRRGKVPCPRALAARGRLFSPHGERDRGDVVVVDLEYNRITTSEEIPSIPEPELNFLRGEILKLLHPNVIWIDHLKINFGSMSDQYARCGNKPWGDEHDFQLR